MVVVVFGPSLTNTKTQEKAIQAAWEAQVLVGDIEDKGEDAEQDRIQKDKKTCWRVRLHSAWKSVKERNWDRKGNKNGDKNPTTNDRGW